MSFGWREIRVGPRTNSLSPEPRIGLEEVPVGEIVHGQSGEPRDELLHRLTAARVFRDEPRALRGARAGERRGVERQRRLRWQKGVRRGGWAAARSAATAALALTAGEGKRFGAARPAGRLQGQTRRDWKGQRGSRSPLGRPSAHLNALVHPSQYIYSLEDGYLLVVDGAHERRHVARRVQLQVPGLKLRRTGTSAASERGERGGGAAVGSTDGQVSPVLPRATSHWVSRTLTGRQNIWLLGRDPRLSCSACDLAALRSDRAPN